MNHRMQSLSKLGMLAGAAAALTLASCGGGEESAKDTTAAGVPGVGTTTPFPGDLPGAIDTMRSDSLDALASRLAWVPGPSQERECDSGPAGCKAWATMSAIAGQERVDSTNLGQYGTIVARMVLDSGPAAGEKKYKLKPNNTYYIIALPGAGGTWSWTLRGVKKNPNQQPSDSIASGTWVLCDHPTPNTAAAMFRTCDDTLATSGPKAGQLLTYSPISPGWMTCSDGCCTAGM